MKVQNLVLAAATGAVVIAGIVLLIKVESSPSVALSEDELAEARRRHQSSLALAAEVPPAASASWTERTSVKNRPAVAARGEPAARPTPQRPALRPRGGGKLDDTPARIAASTRPGAPGEELETRMAEANKLYDRADYETALERADELLQQHPDNIRMLRVAISSACIIGQEDIARQYYGKLPERDRKQMSKRCARYGVQL